jgi:predicted metal-dependent peptidase
MGKRKNKCGVCGEEGHNARTCPIKKAQEGKELTPDEARKVLKKIDEVKEEMQEQQNVELYGEDYVKTNHYDLNRDMAFLLMSEPFFGVISRYVTKVCDKNIPTAGVRVTGNGKFELRYNPTMFANLTKEQKLDILKHEFYHLALGHVTDRNPDPKGGVSKPWNHATDLAINSHLKNLPDWTLMPGQPGPYENYPKEQASEWYYNTIMKDIKDGKMGGGEGGEGLPDGDDDHSGWADGEGGAGEQISDETRELAKQRLQEYTKRAASESLQNGWGTVSSDMKDAIVERITVYVDWENYLRYFVRCSQRATKKNTKRRINKRMPYIQPGRKVTRTSKILVAVDESGSVGDALLGKFFGALNGLSDMATFTVLPFDTECGEPWEWKKGQDAPTFRTKCGGTCFDAPTRYANEHPEYDGLVILTDLGAPKPEPCNVQRMWLTDEANANNPYFETDEIMIVLR